MDNPTYTTLTIDETGKLANISATEFINANEAFKGIKEIEDDSITTSKLKDNCVTESKLSTDVQDKLNNGSGEIKDNSITTSKLQDNCVTESKLSTDVQDKLNNANIDAASLTLSSVLINNKYQTNIAEPYETTPLPDVIGKGWYIGWITNFSDTLSGDYKEADIYFTKKQHTYDEITAENKPAYLNSDEAITDFTGIETGDAFTLYNIYHWINGVYCCAIKDGCLRFRCVEPNTKWKTYDGEGNNPFWSALTIVKTDLNPFRYGMIISGKYSNGNLIYEGSIPTKNGNMSLIDFITKKVQLGVVDLPMNVISNGRANVNSGHLSVTSGNSNIAAGAYSTVFGGSNYVFGYGSFAAGVNGRSTGDSAITIGKRNRTAGGMGTVAIGCNNTITLSSATYRIDDVVPEEESNGGVTAIGRRNVINVNGGTSVAIGEELNITKPHQTVVGRLNSSDEEGSFVVGDGTSNTQRINAICVNNATTRIKSLVVGDTIANGVMTVDSKATRIKSLVVAVNSNETTLSGIGAGAFAHGATGTRYIYDTSSTLIEGASIEAKGNYSHAEGSGTLALGNYSHAEGMGSTSVSTYSHAEGNNCVAYADYSHAEGEWTKTRGAHSHAEGNRTEARSRNSHTEGSYTKTGTGIASWVNTTTYMKGDSCISAGAVYIAQQDNIINVIPSSTTTTQWVSTVLDQYQHAEGDHTIAIGVGSHAEGFNTTAKGEYQHVSGKYNIIDNENKYAYIIGNGTSNNARKNAFTVDWNGNITAAGTINGVSIQQLLTRITELEQKVQELTK